MQTLESLVSDTMARVAQAQAQAEQAERDRATKLRLESIELFEKQTDHTFPGWRQVAEAQRIEVRPADGTIGQYAGDYGWAFTYAPECGEPLDLVLSTMLTESVWYLYYAGHDRGITISFSYNPFGLTKLELLLCEIGAMSTRHEESKLLLID